MNRRVLLGITLGVGAVLLGLVQAVVNPSPVDPAEPTWLASFVALGLLAIGAWRLWEARQPNASDDSPVARTSQADTLQDGPGRQVRGQRQAPPPGQPGQEQAPPPGQASRGRTPPQGQPAQGQAPPREQPVHGQALPPGQPNQAQSRPPGQPPQGQARPPAQPGQGQAPPPANRPPQGPPEPAQPGQPHPGQPHPSHPHPAQPHPGQPHGGQSHPAQPQPAEPHPDQGQPGAPGPEVPAGGSEPPADGDVEAAPPWSKAGALVARAPERTPGDRPLAGDYLAYLLEEACEVASQEGSVEAGLAVVRPTLRQATGDVLVRTGASDAEVGTTLDEGAWTGDRLAASVLAGTVDPPPEPLRARLRAWLFPETVVRQRVARAVDAIDALAREALPTIVGQRAPRPIPVATPGLEELNRHPDGSLRRGRLDEAAEVATGAESGVETGSGKSGPETDGQAGDGS